MSGFEIVGVILGVIPLIIEAFDRSEQAFAAFAAYRRYPKELAKLDSKLGAQKTVFRNNCNNLLSTITNDRQKVHDMLSQPSHEAWQDKILQQNFKNNVGALDQSFESCQQTMEQIYEALQSISQETEDFKAALAVDPMVSNR
jgi:DNA repair ATPase RecN